MRMRENERNKVLKVCEMGEERIRELCERVAVEIERMNMKDWRVCEVDGGGKVIQTCEIIKEGGREGVETIVIEGERGRIEEGLKKDWE